MNKHKLLASISAILATSSLASADGAPAARYDVTVAQDFTHTAYQTLDETGGTVSATGADGTVYTLTLPAGALVARTAIAVTPVANQAQNFPFPSGVAAGVQLEPEGLILFAPGTLTIQFATAPDPKQLLGFCHSEDGVGFHLCPTTLSGNTLTFTLFHFSGYGGTAATPDQATAYNGQNQPSARQAQAEQQIALDIQSYQNGSVDDAGFQAAGQRALGDWDNSLLKAMNLLVKAGDQGDLAEGQVYDLITEYTALGKLAHLFNYQTGNAADESLDLQILLDDLAFQELRHCWDPEGSAVIGDLVVRALSYARSAQLISGGGGADSNNADLFSKIQACLTFTVDFHSGMQTNTPKGMFLGQLDGSFVVSATDSSALGALSGTGSLKFSTASTSAPVPGFCKFDYDKGSHDAQVFSLKFDGSQTPPLGTSGRQPVRPGRPTPPPPPPAPSQPSQSGTGNVQSLIFDLGNPLPNEAMNLTCVKSGHTIKVPMGSFWDKDWTLAHADEYNPRGGNFYIMKDWTLRSPTVRSVIATKDYNRSVPISGGASAQEITEIQVTHTPQQKPNHNPPGYHNVPTLDGWRTMYNTQIKPQFSKGETDETATQNVVSAIEKWYDGSLVFGDALKAERDGATAEALHILDSVVNLDQQACAGGKLEMGARMLYWMKWSLGHDLISKQPGFDPGAIQKKIEDCFKFSFSFSSDVKLMDPKKPANTFEGILTADGKVSASLDAQSQVLTLTGVPGEQYAIASYPQGDCTVTVSPTPDTFTVIGGTIKLKTVFGSEAVELRTLNMNIGNPTENGTGKCKDTSGPVNSNLFAGMFASFHFADKVVVGGVSAYGISSWDTSGGSGWAKIYDEQGDPNRTEHTEIRLIHD